jgi:predicted phosphodiesterase
MTHKPRDLTRRSFLQGVVGASALTLPGFSRISPAVPTLSLLPFLARPTRESILINVRNGHAEATAQLQFRPFGEDQWMPFGPDADLRAGAFVDWTLDGLNAGTDYEYRILTAALGGDPGPVARGRFTTQRTGEVGFDAALITDAHTGAFIDGEGPIEVLDEVVRNVRRDRPDFVVALGDNVAWSTSRNLPQADEIGAERAYTMYRRHLAPLSASCPHFGLIGNWEGESGKLPPESVGIVEGVRRQFAPNPNDATYPEGGSEHEDYYAFDWGPVLFVVLNVQSYTSPSGEQPTPRDDVTVVEDWTLGPEQFAWMERTLSASTHPYKFVCIHHAVGGEAGTQRETLYGRGGHRAAGVGEQRLLHEAMREHGVQIFLYGHDHVFVDEVVDGIHYTLPGSCGAPWHFGREVTGYRRFWADSGHARLSVRPERATVSFVNLAGQVIHEFGVAPNRG